MAADHIHFSDRTHVPGHNSYKAQIFTEQVRQLYDLAPIGFVASYVNAFIVFFITHDAAHHGFILPWLIAVIVITTLRAGLVFWFRSSKLEPSAAPIWMKRFLAGLVLTGTAWGAVALLPFSELSLAHQVFIAFVLGGMAAGASSTFSAIRHGYAAFAIPALAPLTIHFLLMQDSFHYAMAAMATLYGFLLWRISRHNYSVNRTSLLLRFENREMIESLKQAKDYAEGLNSQLRAEMDAKLRAETELMAHQEHLERVVEERTADVRESRERLVLAQRAGRVGVFDWDLIGNSVIWTEELEELFGLLPGSFEKNFQGWARRIHPLDLQGLKKQFGEWMKGLTTEVEFEYRFVRADGETRWMAASADITYLQDGTPARMIGTNVDVTDLKEAQAKLTAAKEAAEAGNMAKSEFLANMSHEMRTPLAGTLGMIRLVLGMEIGTEERQFLEMANRSADSLLRLISDVLDFSRLEAGEMKFDENTFPLTEVIKTAIEVVSLSAMEKKLRLSWQVEDGVPQYVKGDEGRLRQVLVNLLGNAAKFTEEGEIEVVAGRLDDPQAGGPFVLFSVRDTGVGIAGDQIEKIFDKFTQLDASPAKRYGGTGLGLALTRQIIEKWGGKIWVESRAGFGSTFHFTFPVKDLDTCDIG